VLTTDTASHVVDIALTARFRQCIALHTFACNIHVTRQYLFRQTRSHRIYFTADLANSSYYPFRGAPWCSGTFQTYCSCRSLLNPYLSFSMLESKLMLSMCGLGRSRPLTISVSLGIRMMMQRSLDRLSRRPIKVWASTLQLNALNNKIL